LKNLIFLGDENIPLLVIKELRKSGYNIISVAENYKGSSDDEILDLSSKNRWIILTFDKDFGDLIYKQKLNKPLVIILLRIAPKSAEYILHLLKWLLSQPDINFEGNFVVMNSDKVRTVKFL
jgi:predicted nuclease of predicted toxin-antitoxin system